MTAVHRLLTLLRHDVMGGALLVGAAVIALVIANSRLGAGYEALRDSYLSVPGIGLELTIGHWAADGLLAVFFFVVGLELKREFTVGSLRNPRTAAAPILAAAGGVAVPAGIYALIASAQPELLRGWAIPAATDIAFAVAVLAIIGSRLPAALRVFLLTLAVVDDLIAIAIIAVFYTEEIHLVPALAAALGILVFAVLARVLRSQLLARPGLAWLVLLPVGLVVWYFVHDTGVHATIAGVVLGFAVPVLPPRSHRGEEDPERFDLAERIVHLITPLSAGVAVPVFAFFAAGVAVDAATLPALIRDPAVLGIMVGLVVGKPIGIMLTTWLVVRFGGAHLDPELRWSALFGMGVLAGIGFTVSLLVAELSFGGSDPAHHEAAKAGVLMGSGIAALLATGILLPQNLRAARSQRS